MAVDYVSDESALVEGLELGDYDSELPQAVGGRGRPKAAPEANPFYLVMTKLWQTQKPDPSGRDGSFVGQTGKKVFNQRNVGEVVKLIDRAAADLGIGSRKWLADLEGNHVTMERADGKDVFLRTKKDGTGKTQYRGDVTLYFRPQTKISDGRGRKPKAAANGA